MYHEEVECPYCEEITKFDDSDMYEQDENYEIECNHCEKIFQASLSYLKCFHPISTECLNTGEHTYKQIVGCPSIYFRGKYRCSQCSLEMTKEDEVATKEEIRESKEELDLFIQLNYKQSIEIAEEEVISNVFNYNKYEEIKKRLAYDLAVLGISAVKTNFNLTNGVVVE